MVPLNRASGMQEERSRQARGYRREFGVKKGTPAEQKRGKERRGKEDLHGIRKKGEVRIVRILRAIAAPPIDRT
jgi:hypothetical protein